VCAIEAGCRMDTQREISLSKRHGDESGGILTIAVQRLYL